MKKLFAEGKNAYIIKVFRRVLFFFLLFPTFVFSQKNNFPIYEVADYPTTPGLNKIFVADIDNRGPYDLVFYNNSDLGYTFHSSERQWKPRRKYFFYPISSIKLLKNAEKEIKPKYIFTSENAGVVGLVSFTEYGGMRLLNVKKVNDYPAKVDAGKFLAVPERQAVVFGSDFTGVSLFSEKNFKLKETKLFSAGSYSAGGLVDIDIDGMNDLVLFNNASRKLLYFLNVANLFQTAKEDELSGEIRKFKVNDFDGDRVRDFSFLLGDSLCIYIVNSNPQNIKRFSIFVDGCVDYKFLNINADNKRDVLAVDSTGQVFAYYNKGKNKFTAARFIDRIKGIRTLATVWNVDRRKLILLTDEGHFSTFEKTDNIDTTKSVLLYGNDFIPPEIQESGKTLTAYWLDNKNFRFNSISVSKITGKISAEDFPLPFSPDNFEIVKSSGTPLFLFEKYLSSGFTYSLTGKGKQEAIFSDTNKIKVMGKYLVEQISDSLNLYLPIKDRNDFTFDTLSISPAPFAALSARKNKFIFLDKNNKLVFSHLEKGEIVVDTAYSVGKTSALFEAPFNNSLSVVIEAKGSRVTVYSNDTLTTYYSSRSLKAADIIPRFTLINGKRFLIIYDKGHGLFLKAEMKTGKSYLRFRPIFNAADVKDFSAVRIKDKNFIIYFNKKLNALTFKEIL